MSKSFQVALVVGKFCPLHLGHESVLRAADASAEQLMILSYTKPEFPGMPAELREQWLRQKFPKAWIRVLKDDAKIPHNDALDLEHREFVANICRDDFKLLPDAVFTSESYGPGFAEHLTNAFGKLVQHIAVDPQRVKIPVTGTQLRADVHGNSQFLSPEVYGSFIQTICFLGAESSGKSTIAERAAQEWKTTWVPEYGREAWIEKDGKLEFADMLRIAQTQVRHEDAAKLKSRRYLFADTSPLTTMFYSEATCQKVDPELERLSWRKYDHIFLCEPDFGHVQDGTRQDAEFQKLQQKWYVDILEARGWRYTRLQGSVDQRLEILRQVLREKSSRN